MTITIDGEEVIDLTSFCEKYGIKRPSFQVNHHYKFPERIKILGVKKYYPVDMTPDDWEYFKIKYVKPPKVQVWRRFSFSNDDYELAESFKKAIEEENEKDSLVKSVRICTARGDVDRRFPPYFVIVDFNDDVYAKDAAAFIRKLKGHFPELYSSKWPITVSNVVTEKHIEAQISRINGNTIYRSE